MNLLYVTAWDSAGRQFNGYQLHKACLARGHSSHMAVAGASLNEPEIHDLSRGLLGHADKVLGRAEDLLGLQAVLPVRALRLYAEPYYRAADIVHLQLLHPVPFFSLLNVPLMSRRRHVVWTVADPWLTSGHCVHSLGCERWRTGCGHCPDLGLSLPIRHDTTAALWRYKHWVMHRARLTLVVGSPWMRERVRQSPILSHLPCHLISYCVDDRVFRPGDRADSRARLGLPEDAIVLAVRSGPPGRNYKGPEYVEEALAGLRLTRPVYLLVFEDASRFERLRGRYHVVELGWVNEPAEIAVALRAADVFLMPSLAESFGVMAVEAMACGTPVVVFEDTALASVVHAPHAGLAVPYRDARALAAAVERLLDEPGLSRALAANGLRVVAENYTLALYIERHMALYESLLAQPAAR